MLTGTALLDGTASLDCVSVDMLICVKDTINQFVAQMVFCIPATVSFTGQPV